MTTFLLNEQALTIAARVLYEVQNTARPWDEAGLDAEETQAIHANYEMDAEAAIQAYLNETRDG